MEVNGRVRGEGEGTSISAPHRVPAVLLRDRDRCALDGGGVGLNDPSERVRMLGSDVPVEGLLDV